MAISDILFSKIHTEEKRDSLLSIHHKGESSNAGKVFAHEKDHQLRKQKGMAPDALTNDASLRKLHHFLRFYFLFFKIERKK